MRKVRPKPKCKIKRPVNTKVSAYQKHVVNLTKELRKADDLDKLFPRIFWHITESQNYTTPELFAEHLLKCMDVTIRNYGDTDSNWYVTAVHTVGKYPYGGNQIRKEAHSKHLWIAASLCYLSLCLALNEKLYYGKLRK